MPILQEYFQNDFKDLSLDRDITVTVKIQDNSTEEISEHIIVAKQRLQQSSDSSVRFFIFYIPETPFTFGVCSTLLNDLDKWKEQADDIVVIPGFVSDKTIGTHSIIYSDRIYIYSERQLSDDEIAQLEEIAKMKSLYITLRSQDYLAEKSRIEKPLAFISYDNRNKELIAKPLANGLNSRLCYVWYDEYSLKVGDSLRESIEKGIKEAKKCILILTPEFLKNSGWTKKEFNSIFTREMIFDEKIVLPIWFNVKKEEIFEYSPSLADTFALQWPNPDDFPEREYKQEVEKIISKIHTAVIN